MDEMRKKADRGENVTAQDVIDYYQMIPTIDPQKMNADMWDACTSNDWLWELWDGIPFNDDGIERDRLVIGLVYSMGLRHFVEIFPSESKQILRDLLS